MVLALVAAIATAGWWFFLRDPATDESPIGRSTPSPSQTTITEGGDLGIPAQLGASGGTAEASVIQATWTTSGTMAPDEGTVYLIIDFSFEGVSGSSDIGPLQVLVADADGTRHAPSYGPAIEASELLDSQSLKAGDKATGKLGFMVPATTVRTIIIDTDGEDLASFEVPGP